PTQVCCTPGGCGWQQSGETCAGNPAAIIPTWDSWGHASMYLHSMCVESLASPLPSTTTLIDFSALEGHSLCVNFAGNLFLLSGYMQACFPYSGMPGQIQRCEPANDAPCPSGQLVRGTLCCEPLADNVDPTGSVDCVTTQGIMPPNLPAPAPTLPAPASIALGTLFVGLGLAFVRRKERLAVPLLLQVAFAFGSNAACGGALA